MFPDYVIEDNYVDIPKLEDHNYFYRSSLTNRYANLEATSGCNYHIIILYKDSIVLLI